MDPILINAIGAFILILLMVLYFRFKSVAFPILGASLSAVLCGYGFALGLDWLTAAGLWALQMVAQCALVFTLAYGHAKNYR